MKVLMGTKNPGKIEGAKLAFERYFDDVEIVGIPVSSDVSAQPLNDEIYKGARNRVDNLKKYAEENNIEADFYIASEAGIMNFFKEWIDINLVVVEDKSGVESVAMSQGFPIPEKYMEEIKATELSHVMDRLFEGKNLGQGKGGIRHLTKGEVTRVDLTRSAFIMALTKYVNGDLWK